MFYPEPEPEKQKLPRNVKAFIFATILWAVPNSLITSYGTLYMLSLGISAVEVGTINSVCFIVKTVLALCSGYIINRLGRRRAAGILDCISWVIPMAIFSAAGSFRVFLFGYVLNCVSVVGGVVSSCFMTEDVSYTERLRGYNLMSLFSSLSTFLTPVAGLIVNHYGLIPAMHWIYRFACLSMGGAALCKYGLLRETSVGRSMEGKKVPNPISRIPAVAAYILKNKKLRVLYLISILYTFGTTISGLYFIPCLTAHEGFSELSVSFIPMINSCAALIICTAVIPRVKKPVRTLCIAIGSYLAGAVCLCISLLPNLPAACFCIFFWAVAASLLGPVISTLTANAIDDSIRTDVYSVYQTFSMLLLSLAGILGGALYSMSPLYFALLLAFFFGAALLTLLLLAGQLKGQDGKDSFLS